MVSTNDDTVGRRNASASTHFLSTFGCSQGEKLIKEMYTGPRSAVGNVSGNRCESDQGVASSIPARSHTFAEIDPDIISMTILLPSPDSRWVVVSYK